jgi:hypothetical protein
MVLLLLIKKASFHPDVGRRYTTMVDICQISVRFFPSTCTRRIGKNCENNIKIKASSATLSQDRALFIYNLDKKSSLRPLQRIRAIPIHRPVFSRFKLSGFWGAFLLPMVANPTNYPIFQRFALKTNEPLNIPTNLPINPTNSGNNPTNPKAEKTA